MKRRSSFNSGWKFHLGELEQKPFEGHSKTGMNGGASNLTNEEGGFYPLPERYWAIFGAQGVEAGNQVYRLHPKLTDSWDAVELPHDWRIHQAYERPGNGDVPNTGLHSLGSDCLPGGLGYYRKLFSIPQEAEGKRLVIEFEGVMRNATVWMNGCFVGEHQSGYSGFAFDITEYAQYGDEGQNVLLVRTDTAGAEGWWGEGGGIYRNTWLYCLEPVHIARDGCFARAELYQDGSARVKVTTTIENMAPESQDVAATFHLLSPQGALLETQQTEVTVGGFLQVEAEVMFMVQNPSLWDLDNPHLYQVEVALSTKMGADCIVQPFGIRSVEYSREGLLLNGKKIEIKGVCVHQDFAGVGIGLTEDILRYRLQRIKDMGGNAYRSAHHMATRTLLDMCDRMGVLVLNETRHFDLARESVEDLYEMIRSSRNHPSVYMYCLANEEFVEIMPQGRRLIKRLIELGRSLDNTRLFTMATAYARRDVEYQSLADVAGFNYDNGDARLLLDSLPNARVMATEDASFVSTRGIYEDIPENGWCESYEGESYYYKLLRRAGIDPGTMGGAISSLPLTDTYHNNYVTTPELGGMFVWTAFDYRGETFPWNWPAVISGYGAMDLCGFEKDVFHFWNSIWTDKPMVYCLPHWTLPDKVGQAVRIEMYSNCDEVELVVNGESQGKRPHTQGQIASWEVIYQPGTIQALGYKNGLLVAQREYKTAGEPVSVALDVVFDGANEVLVKAKVVDENGEICPNAAILVTFKVENGVVLGVGNGNPSCHEPDVSDSRSTFNGLALGIIRRAAAGTPITISVQSEELGIATINV